MRWNFMKSNAGNNVNKKTHRWEIGKLAILQSLTDMEEFIDDFLWRCVNTIENGKRNEAVDTETHVFQVRIEKVLSFHD